MSVVRIRRLLLDVLDCVDRIGRFTRGQRYENFVEDELVQAGVERQFITIGEALSPLRRIEPPVAAQVPDISQIIAFRNVLVHRYAMFSLRVVWDSAVDEVPKLRASIEFLLQELPKP